MNKVLYKKHGSRFGFTIAELVVYIGILTLGLVAVVTLLTNSAKIMQTVHAEKEVRTSAMAVLERMAREIKNSDGVVLSESRFGESSGELVLLSRFIDDNPRKVSFRVNESDELEIFYDDIFSGILTSAGAAVESLVFEHSKHGVSESVRIELVLYAKKQPAKKTRFYSTAVLRGLY